jgi:serine/threonine protein kinase
VERPFLDQPLGFGDGLTDDTYLDWILQRSKRFFLILMDIGVPELIFGVVDDSWDDEDLPLSMDAIAHLGLRQEKKGELSKRFYRRQFAYLMQEINQGDHLTYGPDEVVPLELVNRRNGVAFFHSAEKVYFPKRPEEVFIRKRVSFGQSSSVSPEKDFREAVEDMRAVQHKHIVNVYASYTYEGSGYVLCTPVADYTLRTFINLPPQDFRDTMKGGRRRIVLNWLHCLAEGVAVLHSHGRSHGNIRPSSIKIDASYRILLGDTAAYERLLGDKKPNLLECYDYGAPENWRRVNASSTTTTHTPPVPRLPSRRRGTDAAQDGPPTCTLPPPKPTLSRTISAPSPVGSSRPKSIFGGQSKKTVAIVRERRDDAATAQDSDVFSLACVFLDMLSFILKRSPNVFSAHRAAPNRSRSGGAADASFHANPDQVQSWIQDLDKRAMKKEDKAMHGIPSMLRLCEQMLSANPASRPTARMVEETLHDILVKESLMRASTLHCNGDETGKSSFEDICEETQSASSGSSADSEDSYKSKSRMWQYSLPIP